ncbi:MAG: selenocysteine-specific translation elongation factor, partial [Dehalococcoidia bacterium]
MYVIGTAGHVDHGKSTLIETLTGIDPDRLREEKARGMTIELGFAWLKLPSGLDVSIVDVPGHERFIKNMLMGVSGIDLALLIVAADEGVMPQTREHLAILDLLDVKRGIAVLTKSALVDSEWLELVSAEVSETLEGTSLEGSPVLAVSAEEGLGLDALMAEIDSALDGVAGRPDLGRPRLPVDRSFTMSGFGAIVTGTLADGRLRVGQEVEILPRGLRARVRGVQTHRTSIDEALPGTRVAVNLSGIEHHEISRGDVVTIPRWLKSTDAFDATFRVI